MILYELSKTVEQIAQECIDADGELSIGLEKRFDDANMDFKVKSSSIGQWILNLDSNETAIEAEIERLKKRALIQDHLRTRLKEYIKTCMVRAGVSKLDMATFTISIAKNPPSVGDIAEHLLPARYVRIVQTTTIDKRAILADLKAGESIPGAYLVTDKTNLLIK